MGNVKSSTIVNDTVKDLTQVVNESTSSCVFTANEDQNLTIIANGANVTVGTINFEEYASVDTSCIASTTVSNNITEELKEEIKQVTKAINQALDLNPGSTDASAVTNIVTQLATNIKNAYTGSCKDAFNQTESATIDASNGATVNVEVLNYSTTFDSVQDCVFTDKDVTSSSQQLQQTISQSATAEVESLLGPLLLIFLIIIIIVGVVLLGGAKGLTNPKFWYAIIAVVVVYLIIAFALKWPPFRNR